MNSQNLIQSFLRNYRGGMVVTLLCLCTLITISLLNLSAEDSISGSVRVLSHMASLQYNKSQQIKPFTFPMTVQHSSNNGTFAG
jgi:hypothetical protein